MFCQYKDILGKVGEGPHSLRIFDIAIVDVILTIIGAYIINLFVFPNCKYLLVLLFLFLLGIVLHRFFCVRTTIDKLLFT
jgi:hypothetical protein